MRPRWKRTDVSDDTDWPRTATAVLADIERLQAIVTDLLALAGWTPAPPHRNPTDLGQLVSAELDTTYRKDIVKDLRQNVFIDCDGCGSPGAGQPARQRRRHATSKITVTYEPTTHSNLEVIDDAPHRPEHRRRSSNASPGWRPHTTGRREPGWAGDRREITEAHQAP